MSGETRSVVFIVAVKQVRDRWVIQLVMRAIVNSWSILTHINGEDWGRLGYAA
jgi:hypothetical protein